MAITMATEMISFQVTSQVTPIMKQKGMPVDIRNKK
jgi:hypothetical protein